MSLLARDHHEIDRIVQRIQAQCQPLADAVAIARPSTPAVRACVVRASSMIAIAVLPPSRAVLRPTRSLAWIAVVPS